jgi:hypothetical protein
VASGLAKSNQIYLFLQSLHIVQEEFPQYDLPIGEWGGGEALVSNAKAAKELGLQLTPLKQTFCDMARTLIQLGIAEPKKK